MIVSFFLLDSQQTYEPTHQKYPALWAYLVQAQLPRSEGWSWRLELECCERKILLGWLELELVAGVVSEEITVALEESRPAEHSDFDQ